MTTTLASPVAEQIVCLHPVSWETFNHLLEELGEKRGQRLAYEDGILEIMSPLGEHESSNRFIESLIGVIADELTLNLKKIGALTLKSETQQKAVEPDSCYYINHEPQVRSKKNIDLTIDPPPDLVLEIDITSGSLNKLPIYASLNVPEIWHYDGYQVRIFALEKEGNNYQQVRESALFPFLNVSLIPNWLKRTLEIGETQTLKEFRQWLRDNIDRNNENQ